MKHERVHRLVSLALALGIAGGSMAGCGPAPAQAGELRSELQRESSPSVEDTVLEALVAGNSAFSLDLYRVLSEKYDNLFFSPYSISLALAMTYGGARGDTELEIAQTLHFDLPQAQLHSAFNALDLELERRAEPIVLPDGEQEGFKLNIANSIWGQVDYSFLAEYLDLLALNYGAGMRVVDFVQEVEAARQEINGWVSDETEGLIEDLIPEGALDEATRLVLANAIYFNAAWAVAFNEEATTDSPFTLLDGGQVQVPMMHQTESMGFAEGDGYQIVERAYVGGSMAMDIILPAQGRFEAIESALDAEWLEEALAGLQRGKIDLSMPRFEFESEVGLSQVLADMGMPTAFGNEADFSGMDGTRALFISDVLHKAFVSVDEKGTEAAAATAVIMALTSAPAEPIKVAVDRPFIFLIRDLQTGAVLFVGRVMNPAA
jgi:serpin B